MVFVAQTMKTAVIIPAHNEERYIATVLQKVRPFCATVIVIDDGSSDRTAAIAKKHTAHIISHETNIGKGAALTTGCSYAFETLHMDAVIFMDADDQHDPREIPRFEECLKNYDVVLGVRNLGPTAPLMRFLMNKAASVLLNILYGAYIPDIPSGYKALTKKGYSTVKWLSSGYEVETEIAMRVAKYKVPFTMIEIDVIYHDTDKGMTPLDGLGICWRLLQWRIGL